MRLWGVTSISSSRYLCKFISFVRLFFFFDKIYIYIYIYTFFFPGVGRESPSYFGVPGLGGQGRVCVVPCDDLGGRKFEIEVGADICHERSQPGQGKGQDSD